MSNLKDMPNIGSVAEALLIQAGINTQDELKLIGSKEAFLRIRLIDTTACLHMLYGLEGAIQGIRDNLLSKEIKQDLKNFFNTL